MQSNRHDAQPHWHLLLWILLISSLTTVAAAQTSAFSIQNSPSPAPAGNILNAVAAISASDAWAVGFDNSSNLNEAKTLTLHFDGTSWKTIPSPNPGKCTSGKFRQRAELDRRNLEHRRLGRRLHLPLQRAAAAHDHALGWNQVDCRRDSQAPVQQQRAEWRGRLRVEQCICRWFSDRLEWREPDFDRALGRNFLEPGEQS